MKRNGEPEAEGFVPVPVESLEWEWMEDYVLNSYLGTDDCRVLVARIGEHVVLKPGEDGRIRKVQAQALCDWIIETRGDILGNQLKYLIDLFKVTQAGLAEALQVSPSAITQIIKGQTNASKQTSRQIAVLFKLEAWCPGFLPRLAKGEMVAFAAPSKAA